MERFDEVYARYKTQVTGQAHRLLGHEDAEDAAQDIWLRVYQHLPRLNGAIGGWLNTVTRNRCIDIQRDRRYAEARWSEALDAAEQVPAPGTLEEQVEHRLRLQQGLARLTPVQRERLLFAAFRCRDWTLSSTLKSQLQRARARMEEEAC